MPMVILIAMLLVLAVLVVGVVLMASSPRLAEKYGNRLMTARVVAQAVCIVLLVVMFASS